ncbi:MAG: site-specific integrase [Nitrososphaeraceae archaeon]
MQRQEEAVEEVELLLDSVKSQETRRQYKLFIRKYMEWQGLKDMLHSKDPRVIEKEIIAFINKKKKEGMTFTALKNYTTAVFSFYRIHDVMINVSKLNKFMPESKRVKEDKTYTHEQISKMLEIADERSRVLILLLASSGIRVGAIPALQIKHLQDNKITIYEKTREQYDTFITPECKRAIDAYIDFRSRYGEKITDSSPLLRNQLNVRDAFAIRNARPVGTVALQWILRKLAMRCDVKTKAVPIAHGFRKFWMTQAVKSRLNPEDREMLLGHKIGLASAYYRPNEEVMYAEYQKGIDNFTIDPSQRLEREVQALKGDDKEITRLQQRDAQREKQLNEVTKDLKRLRKFEIDYNETWEKKYREMEENIEYYHNLYGLPKKDTKRQVKKR